jgi:hypothetical protein
VSLSTFTIAESEPVPKNGGQSSMKDRDGHLNPIPNYFLPPVKSPPKVSTHIRFDRDKHQNTQLFDYPVEEDFSYVTSNTNTYDDFTIGDRISMCQCHIRKDPNFFLTYRIAPPHGRTKYLPIEYARPHGPSASTRDLC